MSALVGAAHKRAKAKQESAGYWAVVLLLCVREGVGQGEANSEIHPRSLTSSSEA